MSIDVEPRDLGQVVQLVAKSDGWRQEETKYMVNPFTYIGGNPKTPFDTTDTTPEELVEPFRKAWLTTKEQRPQDFNGLKVAVRRLAVIDGILETEGVITDYFTLWGLPKTKETRKIFRDHERDVVINRTSAPNAIYETDIPWGICTHNILLDRNGDILMMVRSQSQGFQTGRVSATEEEQTEPRDFSAFFTSARSFREELNVRVSKRKIRLLGVALEKGAAYPAFSFVVETGILARDLANRWKKARDYNENTALLAVEMTEVDKWLGIEEVTSDIWHNSLLAGDIAHDVKLILHPTSAWRINLAKKYSYLAK